MADDLELREVEQYCGTESYHQVMGSNVTDGVFYVMSNGYSWFVTDFLALILCNHKKLREQEFLSIKLKLKDGKGTMEVTDGNGKVLYTQEYK